MLNIDTTIRLTKAVTASPNLCDRLTADDLRAIGEWVSAGYMADEQSRFPDMTIFNKKHIRTMSSIDNKDIFNDLVSIPTTNPLINDVEIIRNIFASDC